MPALRWPAPDQIGEVHASVRMGDDVQIEPVDVDLGEYPGPARQTGGLQVEIEAPHTQDRRPIRLREAEVGGLEGEQEGIDAHLADARLALEYVAHDLGDVALDEPRQEQETEQRIRHDQAGPDLEQPAAQDAH